MTPDEIEKDLMEIMLHEMSLEEYHYRYVINGMDEKYGSSWPFSCPFACDNTIDCNPSSESCCLICHHFDESYKQTNNL